MATAPAHTHDDSLSDPRHHSHSTLYVVIYLVLLVLTGLTVWTGNTDSINEALGSWSIVLALAIASVKGLLVALYFMHLSEASGTNKLVISTAVGFVILLIGLALADANWRFRYSNSPGSMQSDMPAQDLPRPDFVHQRLGGSENLLPEPVGR